MLDFSSALYKLLGERIKVRREELNLSQSDLSNILKDLKRASISNIEKGRQHPPLDTVYKLCNALKLDVHSILPTYSEVNYFIEKESSTSLKFDKFINSFDVDNDTLEQIKNLINKDKNET
ncbi:helix-turn-helix domain-containing protein [Flavobacterium psychrophilum]|uniref:helix-turn-helix domain-containing protein n=1 Tax=Flavobacterium psychrophilum TaxID=96345 RepID=UPI00106DC3A1|nr:helix-turn-helix transcriptional regulator [Flavobacterium psychrophilum]